MTDTIVILTGAGISAESGLGTFRDADGLWTRYDLEEVATPGGYRRNPGLVHDFYNARRANCLGAQPNAAHAALARLGREWPGEVAIVTQNVDDLHERAGSAAVIHMHGELMRALCSDCGHRWDAPQTMSTKTACPHCGRSAARPDVVWFGEVPYYMDRIGALLEEAGVFAAIGTSGTVYPAAAFVGEAAAQGARTVELNLDRSDLSHVFDEVILGPATRIVPDWVDRLLSRA